MITSRKNRKLLLSIFLLATLLPASAANACNEQKQPLNITGVNNMTFRFEDYEKEEDGKKRLLELFPIGSDINKFTNAMKSIKGIKCIDVYKDGIACMYVVPISKDIAYGWAVDVSSEASKITELKARKRYGIYYPPGTEIYYPPSTPPVGLPVPKK